MLDCADHSPDHRLCLDTWVGMERVHVNRCMHGSASFRSCFWSVKHNPHQWCRSLLVPCHLTHLIPYIQCPKVSLMGCEMGLTYPAHSFHTSYCLCVAFPRWCFALGACEAWWRANTLGQDPSTAAAEALSAQRGWGWLLKRCLILHVDKLLALGAFGALLQEPGALGLALLAGLCAALPWLSGSQLPLAASAAAMLECGRSGSGFGSAGAAFVAVIPSAPHRARAMPGALQGLLVGWLCAEAAVHTPWVRDNALCTAANTHTEPSSCTPTGLALVLRWLGVPFAADQTTPGATLFQACAGLKCALLCACFLRAKAWRWVALLPPQVRVLRLDVDVMEGVIVLAASGHHLLAIMGCDHQAEAAVTIGLWPISHLGVRCAD